MAASGDARGRSILPQWELSLADPVDPAGSEVGTVRAAMSDLVRLCRVHRRPLPIVPVVVGTTAGAGPVEAHLAAPLGRAPEPWVTRRHVWSIDAATLSVPTSPPDDGPVEAYPALLPLGRRDGRPVFVDLGAAPGPISVAGDPAAVSALLERLCAAAQAAPGVRVVVVGDPAQDAGVDGGEASTSWSSAPRITSPAEVMGAPLPDLGGVRGRWGVPAREMQDVVLCARALDAAETALVRAGARRRDAPVVIAPGEGGVWRWTIDDGVVTW